MIIQLPLRFEGSKGVKHLNALFDKRATYSSINENVLDDLANLTPLRTPIKLTDSNSDTILKIDKVCRLDFYHKDIRLSDEFLVVPGVSEEVIIGAATMQKWRLKLDFENDNVIVDPRVAKLILINLIKKD